MPSVPQCTGLLQVFQCTVLVLLYELVCPSRSHSVSQSIRSIRYISYSYSLYRPYISKLLLSPFSPRLSVCLFFSFYFFHICLIVFTLICQWLCSYGQFVLALPKPCKHKFNLVMEHPAFYILETRKGIRLNYRF